MWKLFQYFLQMFEHKTTTASAINVRYQIYQSISNSVCFKPVYFDFLFNIHSTIIKKKTVYSLELVAVYCFAYLIFNFVLVFCYKRFE